jgi:DNA-binding Xre family transcriptional regulator
MERAKIIREIMNNKSMKVADIVRISGLPYSTVKYILENGVEKASYTNVQKICKSLGTSVDDLEKMVSGNEEPTTIAAHFDGDEFTAEELDEIRQFAEFVKNKRK